MTHTTTHTRPLALVYLNTVYCNDTLQGIAAWVAESIDTGNSYDIELNVQYNHKRGGIDTAELDRILSDEYGIDGARVIEETEQVEQLDIVLVDVEVGIADPDPDAWGYIWEPYGTVEVRPIPENYIEGTPAAWVHALNS